MIRKKKIVVILKVFFSEFFLYLGLVHYNFCTFLGHQIVSVCTWDNDSSAELCFVLKIDAKCCL